MTSERERDDDPNDEPVRTFFCHGCGDVITAEACVMHDGEGYCHGCWEAPAEE